MTTNAWCSLLLLVFCAAALVMLYLDRHSHKATDHGDDVARPTDLMFCASCPPQCTGRHRRQHMVWDAITWAYRCQACCGPKPGRRSL